MQRKKQNEANERELDNKFNRLHGIINSDSEVNEAITNECDQIKAQLEDIELERARGIILRSKTQWEKVRKILPPYFLRLEKHNFCNKLITKIKTEKEVITHPKNILEERRKYHMKLYSDDDENLFKLHRLSFVLPIYLQNIAIGNWHLIMADSVGRETVQHRPNYIMYKFIFTSRPDFFMYRFTCIHHPYQYYWK